MADAVGCTWLQVYQAPALATIALAGCWTELLSCTAMHIRAKQHSDGDCITSSILGVLL